MRIWARTIGAGLLVALALVGFAAAFGLASTAGADTGTTETTTEPTQTEPPVPEPPAAKPPTPRVPAPIAYGVTVGGVKVGGFTRGRATDIVKRAFSRPLVLVVSPTRKLRVQPSALGARPRLAKAIRRARVARPGAVLPLDVDVSRARVRRYVERIARELDVKPVDARLMLDGVKPRTIASEEGRRLKRLVTSRAIRGRLALNDRSPVTLEFEVLRPKVPSSSLDQSVVILRESKRLLLFDDTRLVRWFRIATGLRQFPTPVGEFEIVTMKRNPWWYPPPSDWAADEQPVPPGPGNPLGTRWMGISAPYVGIHGTPDAASIGYSASHGCIRMRISDAEWLFQRVKVGTPVFIIPR